MVLVHKKHNRSLLMETQKTRLDFMFLVHQKLIELYKWKHKKHILSEKCDMFLRYTDNTTNAFMATSTTA